VEKGLDLIDICPCERISSISVTEDRFDLKEIIVRCILWSLGGRREAVSDMKKIREREVFDWNVEAGCFESVVAELESSHPDISTILVTLERGSWGRTRGHGVIRREVSGIQESG
jgi:hypothetical protein